MNEPSGCRGWMHCRVGDFELRLEWDVEPGRTLVLFGPSGAGKSTALRAMAGLLRPVAGNIEIDGRPVYDSGSGLWLPAHRRRVGYLTQQYNLFPHLTLYQNVSFGLNSVEHPQGNGAIGALLESFELQGLEDRYPWELSGGQQQRAALARALAIRPRLLLLDEPFAAVDAGLRRSLRQELRATLTSNPIPVVLVTHDREEALSLGDDVQVIDEGQAIASGPPVEVLGQPGQATVARLVGVENMFRMRVESRHPRDGTMRLAGEGAESGFHLETPIDEGSSGPAGEDRVTVGIRASDIILSSVEPAGSSARNRIPGIVSRIEARPPGYMVELECGVSLLCQVTGASLEEMGVEQGQRLWAVFKASSCFLVRDSQASGRTQSPGDGTAGSPSEPDKAGPSS